MPYPWTASWVPATASHWNVSEIPPFRLESKPPLPDGHCHHRQQEKPFLSVLIFSLEQMATTAGPAPCALRSLRPRCLLPFPPCSVLRSHRQPKPREMPAPLPPGLCTWSSSLGFHIPPGLEGHHACIFACLCKLQDKCCLLGQLLRCLSA